VSKHKDGNANQLATARETTNRAGMNKKRNTGGECERSEIIISKEQKLGLHK